MTPRPEALRCRLGLALPPGLRLRRLAVRGSFRRILSTKAAPAVSVGALALARWVDGWGGVE